MKLIILTATLLLISSTALAQGNLYNSDWLSKDSLNKMKNNRAKKPAPNYRGGTTYNGQQKKPLPGYNWGHKGQLGGTNTGSADGSNIRQMNPIPRTRQQAPRRTTHPSMGKMCCPNGYMYSWAMCVPKKQGITNGRVFSTGTIDSNGMCRGYNEITNYLTGGK